MSTSFSQDSSSGRSWQRGRHPAPAGGLRPRLLLLAGGWAAGVATEYYFERSWGARAATASLSSTSNKGLEKPRAPTRGTTAPPQAPPSPSAHAAAPAAQQSPVTSSSSGNAAPAQTGAAAVWRDAPAHALSNPGACVLSLFLSRISWKPPPKKRTSRKSLPRARDTQRQ